jgi:hypothetical protein
VFSDLPAFSILQIAVSGFMQMVSFSLDVGTVMLMKYNKARFNGEE